MCVYLSLYISLSLYIYIYIYTHFSLSLSIHIYIYIYRYIDIHKRRGPPSSGSSTEGSGVVVVSWAGRVPCV